MAAAAVDVEKPQAQPERVGQRLRHASCAREANQGRMVARPRQQWHGSVLRLGSVDPKGAGIPDALGVKDARAAQPRQRSEGNARSGCQRPRCGRLDGNSGTAVPKR